MLRRQDIEKWLAKRPFKPFVIEVSTGERFQVTHPEGVWIGDRSCLVGSFRRRVFQDWAEIAIVHIMKLEPLNGIARARRRRRRKAKG